MSATTALEGRYRLALRAYPARWRATRGEELVGVMMDVAAEKGKTKASTAEILHLALHGLTARANQALSVVPRRRRDRLAAVGLIAGTALALMMLVLGEFGRWFRWNSYTFADHPFGPVTTPAAIVFLLALGAFLAQAVGRAGVAKCLHVVTILASVALAIVLETSAPTIGVPLIVFVCFTVTSLLALAGNPTRTPRLRQLVVVGSPALGVIITLTSYLQGSGSQKTFWPPDNVGFIDGSVLSRWTLELALIAALITIAGSKTRPWACLILIPLASAPLSTMFMTLGGRGGGHITIEPAIVIVLCFLAALISAWAAWKRPILLFPTKEIRPHAK
ncbi:hypothetical protein [Arthrobacter flavus]|uniref:Uncharacterized protein n=1 Tax=Arthrobacter flavus TaxID=95172 RepID=A0ABW4Q6W2_9MICC